MATKLISQLNASIAGPSAIDALLEIETAGGSSLSATVKQLRDFQAGQGPVIGGGGSHKRIGTATLSGGTVTVTTSQVDAASRIFLTGKGATNAGFLYVDNIVNDTSFDIKSSNGSDARDVHWVIIEEA